MTESPWSLPKPSPPSLEKLSVSRIKAPTRLPATWLRWLPLRLDRAALFGRAMRLLTGRKIGLLAAVLLAAVSVAMILNDVYSIDAGGVEDLIEKKSSTANSSGLHGGSPFLTIMKAHPADLELLSSSKSGDSNLQNASEGISTPKKLYLSYAPPIPQDHPCFMFALPPPPPPKKKKSGFRPCPVCYLPVEEAVAAKPSPGSTEADVALSLSYATEEHPSEVQAKGEGRPPKFGGYPTLEDRQQSFSIQNSMNVHCGFVWGKRPGEGSGYDFSDKDREAMEACHDVVVASAIFGAYDALQQPVNISERSKQEVCFFMFVDEESYADLQADGSIPDNEATHVGIWRIVIVHNLPFTDPRRTGKIPKLLIHRLFPNARFSIWMDGKLQLTVDPYQVLERFLWRGGFSWAISKHYQRFDVFEEAERNKAAGKYANASIDDQVRTYRREGLTPYSPAKLPIVSDVPEGCLIIREHTPLSRLFGCLWFNEVDRFTSRDQLSFAFTRDKVLAQAPWRQTMFLDCERRNFVVQGYHKPDLREKMAAKLMAGEPASTRERERESEGEKRSASGDSTGRRRLYVGSTSKRRTR